MLSLQIDCHIMRLEHRLQCLYNLLPGTLLYREALRAQAYRTGKLGDAYDFRIGDVACVGMSVK
jgi:hypothetical protein